MQTELAQIAGRIVSNGQADLVGRLVRPEERDRGKTLMAAHPAILSIRATRRLSGSVR